VTVPAGGRVSVWTKGIPGLAYTSFRTVVAVTNGVGIVAERATYWPLNTGGGVYSASAGTTGAESLGAATPSGVLAPLTIPIETGADTNVPAVQTFNPYAPTTRLGTAPRLYQNLLGYPTTKAKTTTAEAEPDTGPPGGLVSGSTVTENALSSALLPESGGGTVMTTTITTTWFGAHLTGGRRR
jgi:hypothetical protein